MFAYGVFRAAGDRLRDVNGYTGRYHDLDHAREVMPDALSIHEVPAEQVRGYYDWVDQHDGAARYVTDEPSDDHYADLLNVQASPR